MPGFGKADKPDDFDYTVSGYASITLVNIGIMPGCRWHYMARIWRLPVVGELFMAITPASG